jgi:hypothetical protein
LGKNRAYRSLLTADLRAKRLGGTELSLKVGLKLVNGQRLYPDLELAAAVAEGVDLFVRNVRPYGLDPQTYLGLRFGSGVTSASFVDAYAFRLGVYPFFDGIKAIGDTGAWLRFFDRPPGRLLISLAASIPVQRGNAFFGRFRPDRGNIFLEFGDGVRVRPFVAVEFSSLTPEEDPLKGKFLFGVTLFKWF